MADSDSRGSEKPEGSESGSERLDADWLDKMLQEIRRVFSEIREEREAARRRCEESTEVVQSGVEEIVAAQSPVSEQQLCGVTGHCEPSLCCRHGETLSVGAGLPVWECSV